METKNQELSRAVEELSKLIKDSGDGKTVFLSSTHAKYMNV